MLEGIWVIFENENTEEAGLFLELLETSMLDIQTPAVLFNQLLSHCVKLYTFEDRKWERGMEGASSSKGEWLLHTFRSFSNATNLETLEVLLLVLKKPMHPVKTRSTRKKGTKVILVHGNDHDDVIKVLSPAPLWK